jgi:multiple sugar transport system substrate-binding protein
MKKNNRTLSRRKFVKVAGAGTIAAGLGPAFLFPGSPTVQQKTLKIIQWRHWIPGYDEWFDNVFAKKWGEKHNTRVIVDHIDLDDVNAHAEAELTAKKGHDLFLFLSPPAAYDKHAIDMTHVYQEVEKKHGKKIDLAHKSTYNPRTKRYFAFCGSYSPNPGNWHKDWWIEAGYPNGPDTWGELRAGARKIRDRTGHPCGLGIAPEPVSSTTLRALLWSFGAAEQDEEGKVAINSPQTVEALEFMKAVCQESQTPEVFTWTYKSHVQAMLAGRSSYVADAISLARFAEREQLPIASQLMLCQPPKGAVRRISPPYTTDCYLLWEFAQNKEGAQQFLIDYADVFHDAFVAGQFYNFPSFPGTCPNLKEELSNDVRANPADKYKVLANASDWTTNIGYPGYASAPMDEAFRRWIIPTMFAKVAKGDATAGQAASAAAAEYKQIFEKWGAIG